MSEELRPTAVYEVSVEPSQRRSHRAEFTRARQRQQRRLSPSEDLPQLLFESCVARPSGLLSGMCCTRKPERFEKLLVSRESSEYQAPCGRCSARDNELLHLPSWRSISGEPLHQLHIPSYVVTHPVAVSIWPPVERITVAGDRPWNSERG